MPGIAESHVEEAPLDWQTGGGYTMLHGPDICLDGPTLGTL